MGDVGSTAEEPMVYLTHRWRELDSNLQFRARAGSILPVRFVADSLLEGTGFELLVPRGDGLRWVSLQFAVASRVEPAGIVMPPAPRSALSDQKSR